jgi:hypothetical protein
VEGRGTPPDQLQLQADADPDRAAKVPGSLILGNLAHVLVLMKYSHMY